MIHGHELMVLLRAISNNLWWSWHPDIWTLFDELDHQLWESTNHNPIVFLDQISEDAIEKAARQKALASRIQHAHRRLEEYLANAGPRANMEAGPLHTAPVAYFCAEFGLHESLPIYSGGLGILAGDHLKAASDIALPLVGVGLFYAVGYFQQSIDDDGRQKEHYGRTNIAQLPINKILDDHGNPIEIAVEVANRTVKMHVWEAPVGRNRLLLLDCDIESNPAEDRQLTTQLYGGNTETRIRQEILLGVGGVRALKRLGITPGVYHLNEGHSAFAPLELCAQIMQEEGETFEDARARVAKMTVFTTHTPVPAGHDRFAPQLLEESLYTLRERLNLNHYEFHSLGRVNPNNPNETFCMTVLAMKMSNYCNGVSHLHSQVSKKMWRDLWPTLPQNEIPIHHITNGVHLTSFMAPEMKALCDRHLGPNWMNGREQRELWAALSSVEPGELWEVHQILKARLLDFVQQRVQSQAAPNGHRDGQVVPGSGFEQDILTIGFARRFATYKRADLIMNQIERFQKLITDSQRPIQIIFAGKAHPADDAGKRLIQKIVHTTTDPAFAGRVVFLADYDMNVGRHLVQGVDLWLNNPRRPQEACGTSGQKAVLNGVLNCSILDGWWAEGYDGLNGFAIGHGQEFTNPADQDAYDVKALYQVLENHVIPTYYATDKHGQRTQWVERMHWAMMSLGWRYNAQRMIIDYMRQAYLPAAGATTSG